MMCLWNNAYVWWWAFQQWSLFAEWSHVVCHEGLCQVFRVQSMAEFRIPCFMLQVVPSVIARLVKASRAEQTFWEVPSLDLQGPWRLKPFIVTPAGTPTLDRSSHFGECGIASLFWSLAPKNTSLYDAYTLYRNVCNECSSSCPNFLSHPGM